MSKNIRAHAIISGKVQGVCFRMETQRTANKYDVKGWVKNKPDRTVEAVFEGNEEDVLKTIQWCKKGPDASRVDDVKVSFDEFRNEFLHFNITY